MMRTNRIIAKFALLTNFSRPRIAYLSSSDPLDKRSWSGTHHFIFSALQKQAGDVFPLGPWRPENLIKTGRMYSFFNQKISGKRFDYSHSLRIAKVYGRYFSDKLNQGNYDLIFAVSASTELAFLETDLPVYYVADATFANMIGYYPFYSNLLSRSVKEGNEVQQRALEKCERLFFPSQWAADSASKDYGIAADKISVIPFGANLETIPEFVPRKKSETLQILFLGVEWERKGGPVALEAFLSLSEKGIDARMTIVGCTPPVQHEQITIIPYLNKNDAAQRQKLNEIFSSSDMLLLPTRAECFGIVFCEASAFGVPSFSTQTGGVNGAVENGINGFLLPENASGTDYAEKIVSLISDREKLNSLQISSRKLFDDKLNWNAWGEAVAKQL